MAAGGKFTKTKVYAGSGNSGQRTAKQARKAGVDQWEEKTAKEKRQYVMPQSAPALQPQPTKQTAPRVPQGPVTKAQDDQTRALVNGTVRAAPQGPITKTFPRLRLSTTTRSASPRRCKSRWCRSCPSAPQKFTRGAWTQAPTICSRSPLMGASWASISAS